LCYIEPMADPNFPSGTPDDDATRVMTAGVAAPAVLQPGTVLGNTYVIEAMLGRGGMGEVYRARHIELGTEHAIKIMLPSLASDPKVVQLFREEARKLGRINNSAIVDYEGFFRDEHGLRYLVTEFVHGESLEQILRRRRLEPSEVLRLRDRLALGLAVAHEMDIVHRDVSPANILLPEGSVDRAKLIDFGIAKSMAESSTTLIGNTFAGKYSFASPEQVGLYGGNVDLRSDIYSLGLVLAAAAIGFGKNLDMGSSPATMLAARQRVPDLSLLPAPLRPVIAPMLEPRPDDRPPSMRALLGSEGEVIRKPGTPSFVAGRRRALGAVAAVAALAVVAGATVFLLHEWKQPPSIDELQRGVDEALARYKCAPLHNTVGPDRSVRVWGHAASADIAQIRQAVGSIDGIAKLDFAVEPRVWPYCDVMAMLQKLIAHPPGASLALVPTSGALVVDVRAPDFDGNLYVDWFNQEQVVHLFPNHQDRLNFVPARAHLILGQPPRDGRWALDGPTGEQLVTLVAAKRELFPEARPEVEDAHAYLKALSQAVGALTPDSGAAALQCFQLEAAPPSASLQTVSCRD
jgi:serine/threonine protein kinase